MSEEYDTDAGTDVWRTADAVLSGEEIPSGGATGIATPVTESLMNELQRIARLVAAHDEHRAMAADAGSPDAAEEEAWGPLVIQQKIGSGAFGDVYRAREPRLDREVAVKFFHPEQIKPARVSCAVIEEGRLLARVHHPNVVTVYGAEQREGRLGIWMEYVEGETLEEVVEGDGPLATADAIRIGRDLGGALAAIHDAGILHRDIKARNVVREPHGRVVLTDLGISCEIDHALPIGRYGTPLYAAPEVLVAGASTPRSDIYSLGILLYYLVSGRYPVEGDSVAEIREAHLAGKVVPLACVRPDLPDGFIRIVDRALAADPDERFESARELEEAVGSLLVKDAGPSAEIRRPLPSSGCYTANRQAYNLYLQGCYFWNRRYTGGLPRAMECFHQALELDGQYALAYVGLADCLAMLSYLQCIRPRDGFVEARATAEKALAFDPELGEAQATLGWISTFQDWDFAAAERHFRNAIRRCPHYAQARQWYALMLASRGRDEEAMAQVAACREPDIAAFATLAEGNVLLLAGRFDESAEINRLALVVDPDSLAINNYLGVALWFGGHREEAEATVRHADEIAGGQDTWAICLLGNFYAMAGRSAEAEEQIARLEALAEQRYVSRYHRMSPWIYLGREDRWGPLLDEAIEERDPYLVWIRPGRIYDPWLRDAHLATRLREAGLLA